MNKDNKNVIANKDSDYKVPPLVAGGYFALLKADRGVNFRKDLVTFLNSFYPLQPLSYITWKGRYNNPLRNIPKNKNFNSILKVMEEGLAFYLNVMKKRIEEDFEGEKNLVDKITNAIKIYNDGKNTQ